jgi:hypothetical protein
MNIVDLLRKKRTAGNAPFSFDTKSSTPSNNAFLIRRESDNVEQTFTYTQINDGTFDTFVAGSEGAIKEWYANDSTKLSQTSTAYQPRLKSGVTNPYVDDYAQQTLLVGTRTVNMNGDSIVSVILKDELNNNSQRANLTIRGTGNKLFSFQLRPGAGDALYDKAAGSYYVGDYGFSYTNNSTFKLFTFTRIGGVKKLYINNVEVTQTTASATYTISTSANENSIVLGGRGVGDSAGKVTKYQHLGLVVGDAATNTNISTYNTDIMTKYGL